MYNVTRAHGIVSRGKPLVKEKIRKEKTLKFVRILKSGLWGNEKMLCSPMSPD